MDFELPAERTEQVQPWLAGRTVAVARDAAFSFIYAANLDCLRAMGARLAFSPLAGERLPDCDALWLPGGYPELHLDALAANARCAATSPATWLPAARSGLSAAVCWRCASD